MATQTPLPTISYLNLFRVYIGYNHYSWTGLEYLFNKVLNYLEKVRSKYIYISSILRYLDATEYDDFHTSSRPVSLMFDLAFRGLLPGCYNLDGIPVIEKKQLLSLVKKLGGPENFIKHCKILAAIYNI